MPRLEMKVTTGKRHTSEKLDTHGTMYRSEHGDCCEIIENEIFVFWKKNPKNQTSSSEETKFITRSIFALNCLSNGESKIQVQKVVSFKIIQSRRRISQQFLMRIFFFSVYIKPFILTNYCVSERNMCYCLFFYLIKWRTQIQLQMKSLVKETYRAQFFSFFIVLVCDLTT